MPAAEDGVELGPTNAEDVSVEDSIPLAPVPLYTKMLRTLKLFTMLEDLILENIRLPVDYPAIIHAFPCLRNLQFIFCGFMDDIPTSNALSTPPASLEKLVMIGMRYPVAIIRRIKESQIDSQGSQLMAPLISLVQSPNLQNLSVDETTAIILIIFLQPFLNNLQVIEVGIIGEYRAFGITTPCRLYSHVEALTLFRLLMLFLSTTSCCAFGKDDSSSVNSVPLYLPRKSSRKF